MSDIYQLYNKDIEKIYPKIILDSIFNNRGDNFYKIQDNLLNSIDTKINNLHKNFENLLSNKIDRDKIDEYLDSSDFDYIREEIENYKTWLKFKDVATLGKVLITNGSEYKFEDIDYILENKEDFEEFEPIGIVVIPAEHNVYGNGLPGIMSLKYARYDDPDNGGDYQGIYWGQYGKDISEFFNKNRTYHINKQTDWYLVKKDSTTWGYMPSDNFSTLYNPDKESDQKSGYYYDETNAIVKLPSPYNYLGERNYEYYYQIDNDNPLADFAGYDNTKILIKYATAQPNWKTAPIIEDDYRSGYSPAACCCWRYHTIGTKQGDWYLPACGELGYVCNRQIFINNIINKINLCKFDISIQLNSKHHWSSSYHSNNIARSILFYNGYIIWSNKNDSNYVRPFLNISKYSHLIKI